MTKQEQDRLKQMIVVMNDESLPTKARIKATEYVLAVTRPPQERANGSK